MKFWWGLTTAGAVLGGIQLFMAMFDSNGAPQQAAGAAMAAALAVIPYVLARSFEGSRVAADRAEALKQQIAARNVAVAGSE